MLNSTIPPRETLLKISQDIARAMANDLRLTPPAQYAWTQHNGHTWMLVALSRENFGKATEAYFAPQTLRHLSDVTGVPVTYNRKALVYLVLLSERPKLPKTINFPAELPAKDVFGLGVALRGKVLVSASTLGNAMIGATQGAGKSNLLKVLTYTAHFNGWPLYLADPQGHTYDPDTWNNLAVEPVARSREDTKRLVARVEAELKNREALFRLAAQARGGVPPADVEAYNQVAASPLSRFMLAIDEANEFLEDKGLESDLTRLAREGRKYGLHLVVAAHNWRDSRGRGVSREFSGRMTTRISLQVSDDTSGDVVLGSVRWGRWVNKDQPKGRGVIRLVGKHIPFQVYYIPDEMEAGWLSGTTMGSVPILTETEIKVALMALTKTDGKINITNLQTECGLGVGEARRIVTEWSDRGWAIQIPSQSNATFITGKFRAITENLKALKTPENRPENLKADLKTACKPENLPEDGA